MPTNCHCEPDIQLLSVTELAKLTGLSQCTIRSKRFPSSTAYDPTFPKPVKLGGKTIRFVKTEILTWIENCRLGDGGVK